MAGYYITNYIHYILIHYILQQMIADGVVQSFTVILTLPLVFCLVTSKTG